MQSRTCKDSVTPGHQAAWRATAAPEIVGTMRRASRRVLLDWGLNHIVDAAELCISELVTNAVLHGVNSYPEVELQLTVLSDRLCIDVTDGDPTIPQLCPPTAENEHGRGLVLVSLMATGFGFKRSATGKTVWCVLEVPASDSTC